MIIATWNINGILRRFDNLLRWLNEAEPDVVCLQELKCSEAKFPVQELKAAGYEAIWRAEGRWNGVAILARGKAPIPTCHDLPGDAQDQQPRYIEAAIDGMIIGSVYAPNGNPQPGPKFDYKIDWLNWFRAHARDRLQNDVPIIFAGDFNVVHAPADIYETRTYDDNALLQAPSRDALRLVLSEGLIDIFDRLGDDAHRFTFWDYRRRRWERNAGLRLDLMLANHAAADAFSAFQVHAEVRGWPDASDHAPVVARLQK